MQPLNFTENTFAPLGQKPFPPELLQLGRLERRPERHCSPGTQEHNREAQKGGKQHEKTQNILMVQIKERESKGMQ